MHHQVKLTSRQKDMLIGSMALAGFMISVVTFAGLNDVQPQQSAAQDQLVPVGVETVKDWLVDASKGVEVLGAADAGLCTALAGDAATALRTGNNSEATAIVHDMANTYDCRVADIDWSKVQ